MMFKLLIITTGNTEQLYDLCTDVSCNYSDDDDDDAMECCQWARLEVIATC